MIMRGVVTDNRLRFYSVRIKSFTLCKLLSLLHSIHCIYPVLINLKAGVSELDVLTRLLDLCMEYPRF